MYEYQSSRNWKYHNTIHQDTIQIIKKNITFLSLDIKYTYRYTRYLHYYVYHNFILFFTGIWRYIGSFEEWFWSRSPYIVNSYIKSIVTHPIILVRNVIELQRFLYNLVVYTLNNCLHKKYLHNNRYYHWKCRSDNYYVPKL